MIILEATSPSGDKVKVDVEGGLVSLIMIAPGDAGEMRVTDTGMAEFFKDLELQLAAGTYQPYVESHQRHEIEK